MTETVQNVGTRRGAGLSGRVHPRIDGGSVDPVRSEGRPGRAAARPAAIFNGSGTVTVSSQTLPGSYRVLACADYKKVVFESNEDANCMMSAGAVQVAAVPDLIVFSVQPPVPQVTVVHGGTVALQHRREEPGPR
jgi:hypothetical protein